MAHLVGEDDPRALVGAVAVLEHDLLEAADVVGVAVGDEVGGDVGDREAEKGEGLGRARAAVDEDMGGAFDEENIVLEEFFRERRARTDKAHLEATVGFKLEGR